MIFTKMNKLDLTKMLNINEAMIQNAIAENTSLLGLGDLSVRDRERVQQYGRLDLLLEQDNTRYCVELQLGELDPSHILRAIGYWQYEQRKNPSYSHVCVLVAENCTGRFYETLHLLNCPLIVIQFSAFQISDRETIVDSTIVFDNRMTIQEETETDFETTDYDYWCKKSNQQAADYMVDMFKQISEMNNIILEPKYNKHYVGATINGKTDNQVIIQARTSIIKVQIKLSRIPDYDEMLDSLGVDWNYRSENRYLINVKLGTKGDSNEHKAIKSLTLNLYQ